MSEQGIKKVALAKISTLLGNKNKPFVPHDEWEHICREVIDFYEVYHKNQYYFYDTYTNHRGYSERNEDFNPIRGVYLILEAAYNKGSETFTELLSAIVNEGRLNMVFIFSRNNEINFHDLDDLETILEKRIKNIERINNPDFHKLINYLNILGLDIRIKNGKFQIEDYSGNVVFNQFVAVNEIDEYIENNTTPKVRKAYENIMDSYANGTYGQCIEACRVVMDGFFFAVANKTDKIWNGEEFDPNLSEINKWFKGISKLSGDPVEINQTKELFEDKDNLKYPRFRAIYSFYRLLCTLGSHRANETPDIFNLESEKATKEDALMCLQITRSIIYTFLKKQNQIQ